MPKISDPRKRKDAFRTYCRYRDMNLIAEECNVTLQTVYSWRRDDKWDEKIKDISAKFEGVFNVMKRAEQDLIVADMFSELNLLEFLELKVGESVVINGLEPKKWSDVLATLKFITDRKDKLFERAKRKSSTDAAESSSEVVEEENTLSEKQKESLNAMFSLISQKPTLLETEQEATVVEPVESSEE